MTKNIKSLISFLLIVILSGCGGGGSDSGTKITIPDIPSIPILPPLPVGSEFKATQCITQDARLASPGRFVRTITNTCNMDVNYRDISSGAFGPTIFIAAKSKVTKGSFTSLESACFAPKVPGGVADILDYQCLG